MAAVTQPAPPVALDGTLATIHAAQATMEAAAAKASMTGDPIHYMLAAWSEGLGAMAVGVEAVRRPADAELRRDIIAVYERQARAAQQQASLLGTAHSRRAAAVSGAVVAVLVLAAGGGAYALGYARGGADAINQACAADAVKEQDGGKVCSFWLTSPTRTGQRKG